MSQYDLPSPSAAESYFNASLFGQLYTLMADSLGAAARPSAARSPRAAKALPAPVAAPRTSLLDRLDRWYWRREQKARDAFLAESADVFELERRIVAIERSGISRYY
jgi:hypothetical protein